jgi:hypothetical protein
VRAVWISGLAAALLLAGLAWTVAPLRPGALALQLAFTPAAFGAIVHSWSPADLARYRLHLWVDYALLAAYGAFGWLLATRTRLFARRAAAAGRAAGWALPLAAASDAAENTLHLWLTEAPRFGVPAVYAIAASCATAKWLLIVAFALAVAVALAKAPRG